MFAKLRQHFNASTNFDVENNFLDAMKRLNSTTFFLHHLEKSLDRSSKAVESLDQQERHALESWLSVKRYLGDRWLLSTLLTRKGSTISDQRKHHKHLGSPVDQMIVFCSNGELKCSENNFVEFYKPDSLKCHTFNPLEDQPFVESEIQGIRNGVTMILMTGSRIIASEFGTHPHHLWLIPGYQNTFYASDGNEGVEILIQDDEIGTPDPDVSEIVDLAPGTFTLTGITSSELIKMKHPHGNCTTVNKEYQKLTKAIEKKLGISVPVEAALSRARYTVVACRSFCLQRRIWERCGCLWLADDLPVFNGSLLCGNQIQNSDTNFLHDCGLEHNMFTRRCRQFLDPFFTELNCLHRTLQGQTDDNEGKEDAATMEVLYDCDCPAACYSTKYDLKTATSEWPTPGPELDAAYSAIVLEKVIPTLKNYNNSIFDSTISYLSDSSQRAEIMKNFVKVTVYLKSLSVQRIEEFAAYSALDLISDVGR